MEESFLSPVEKPKSILMKLAYFFSQKQLGKVIAPLRVQYARLPIGFALFSKKISTLDKKLILSQETATLIRAQVARINICLFCIDISRAKLIKDSMNEAKFDALDHYQSSPHYTVADRVVLDYVAQLTKEKRVTHEAFMQLSKHYSEREICEIIWLVASEHFYNMTNIGLNIHSDQLCDIAMKNRKSRL